MFDIAGNRRWYLSIAGALAIAGAAALIGSAVQFGQPLRLSAEPAGLVTAQTAGQALLAVVIAVAVLLWWSVRSAPNAVRYGVCTVALLAFSLLVTSGFYALMGILAAWEADALFFVAILAVVGLSAQGVHAIFDHMRENLATRKTESFERVSTRSILETVNHTLVLRLCAVFVLAASVLFGGAIIKPFVATMLVGVVADTYAVLFVAAPLMVAWEKASARRAARRAAT
jgi:preprotein translocase subunit SecF